MYTTDSEPLSPLSTSYSLVNSLDALSISTSSLPSARIPSTGSSASGSGHSRRTSSTGSHISVPSSYGQPPASASASASNSRAPRLSTSSEDYEVILLPRSVPATPQSIVLAASRPRSRRNGRNKGKKKEADPALDSGNTSAQNRDGTVANSAASSESGAGSQGDGVNQGKGKAKIAGKTRRSGRKAKRRIENGQNRDADAVEDALGSGSIETPRKVHSATPINREVGAPKARGVKAETMGSASSSRSPSSTLEEDEEDEVDALSDLDVSDSEDEEISTGSRRSSRRTPSILSADDARSSIDEFLAQPLRPFTKGEKLRFWQSLCYELDLADIEEEGAELSLPDLPVSKIKAEPSVSSSERSSASVSSSRTATPTQYRPMPQTLRQAKQLLQDQGHVNLADYFAAREERTFLRPVSVVNKDDGVVQIEYLVKSEDKPDQGDGGTYGHLVYSSVSQMRRYTKVNKKFVKLAVVKAEVLQPLLRDFGFKRARERA